MAASGGPTPHGAVLHYDNQTFASLDDDPCVVVTVRVPDGSGGMKDVVTRIDKKTGQVVGNPAGS